MPAPFQNRADFAKKEAAAGGHQTATQRLHSRWRLRRLTDVAYPLRVSGCGLERRRDGVSEGSRLRGPEGYASQKAAAGGHRTEAQRKRVQFGEEGQRNERAFAFTRKRGIRFPKSRRRRPQIEAQRSGFDLERRRDGVSEGSRLRGPEGYAVHADDVSRETSPPKGQHHGIPFTISENDG